MKKDDLIDQFKYSFERFLNGTLIQNEDDFGEDCCAFAVVDGCLVECPRLLQDRRLVQVHERVDTVLLILLVPLQNHFDIVNPGSLSRIG